MELREFAERILFTTSLEEKLRAPAELTDERPGPAILAPAQPGRPKTLLFKPTGTARDEFPGTNKLEDERVRGRLLHFFANHELLATELMALALLRFPDAPAAFRKGLVQTLRDEQEHTRLYIDRMKESGFQFGEVPVSGFFWRAVSGMESPMDYVSGLSLTFEQANLDFARHFARGFADVGDEKTARLLEKIYRDEIGHVAYGLKWFRRWKNPDESDWAAFCRQLKFPLTPRRAKGFTLNVDGRRAAGLDADFISELEVNAQSRGRTPNVYLFNPFAEARIAKGRGFNPSKLQSQLARDLANLPQFVCRQDDIVLVEQRPRTEFLAGIKRAGFHLPEFIEFDWSQRNRVNSITELAGRKLGRLRPWAWGPDSVDLLEPLFRGLTAEKRTSSGSFNSTIASLFSKTWSASFLRRVLGAIEPEPWICGDTDAGIAVNSLSDALAAIATIRGRGHHRIVVKQSLGLAGNNAVRLFEPALLETHRRWMINTFESGREVVVEPWLDRLMDFSVQLEMAADSLKLVGYTALHNNPNGQFQANSAGPGFDKRPPARLCGLFSGPPDIARRVRELYSKIFGRLEAELKSAGFVGPVGIDAFVFRTADGVIRLKPVVEINPRYTMGRVTVELMKHTAPGSFGKFSLLNRSMIRAAGARDFIDYARRLEERYPLRLEGEPVPRIGEGALCLGDPDRAQACLAVFQVGRTADP